MDARARPLAAPGMTAKNQSRRLTRSVNLKDTSIPAPLQRPTGGKEGKEFPRGPIARAPVVNPRSIFDKATMRGA